MRHVIHTFHNELSSYRNNDNNTTNTSFGRVCFVRVGEHHVRRAQCVSEPPGNGGTRYTSTECQPRAGPRAAGGCDRIDRRLDAEASLAMTTLVTLPPA